jgi:hypothetical protein
MISGGACPACPVCPASSDARTGVGVYIKPVENSDISRHNKYAMNFFIFPLLADKELIMIAFRILISPLLPPHYTCIY